MRNARSQQHPLYTGYQYRCFHDDVIKWKHFSRNWPFVRGFQRSPVNSLHKGQWRGALMFSLKITSITTPWQLLIFLITISKTAIDGTFRKRKNINTSTFPCNKWYDDECKAAKRRLHDIPKKGMTEDNRYTYQRLMREYKALIERKKRNYHLAIASDVKHLHECDPKGYWRFWKRFRPSHRNYELLDAETFTDYKNLGNKPDNSFFDNQLMVNIDEFISRYDGEIRLNTNIILDDILNAPISIDETKASLKYMKVNKAAGTDGIPSEFYKYTCNILDQPLTALFNNVLDTGSYLSTWCVGLINPLHKPDSPTLPDNYRKITITPAIGKLFDGILNNRLQFATECLSMGDPFQNGFKPNQVPLIISSC